MKHLRTWGVEFFDWYVCIQLWYKNYTIISYLGQIEGDLVDEGKASASIIEKIFQSFFSSDEKKPEGKPADAKKR